MLIGRANSSVRRRVAGVLAAAAVTFAGGVGLTAAGGWAGWWEWPPRPSSEFGVALGLITAGIVLFEMLLWPRKLFRRWRLGATKKWLWWHVWLGFISLPVVVVHAGFGLGGPLPAATMLLFLGVYASGVWGLILQQWIPQKLLAEVPGETVATEGERLAGLLMVEVGRVMAAIPVEGVVTFCEHDLLPYIRRGADSASPLRSRGETERRFQNLRRTMPPEVGPHLDRLRELADARRQLDAQRWWQGWLHGWLAVHLPLSVAMTGLMLLHAVRALKYW